MSAKIYYDQDADLSVLKGKTIAILGYGSQGHAQAQNLRDSGCDVIIGQRPGSKNYDLAKSHKFEPVSVDEATKKADLVNKLLPDEVQGDIYKNHVKPNLKPGAVLMASHGFNFHFGQVEPPAGTDTMLVAPKGPGHLVRSEYVKGGGVPCLIALGPGASDQTRKLGLAYAKGIGGARAGVIETTIAEETETDLFGEQVVLCGGVSELVKAGFEQGLKAHLHQRGDAAAEDDLFAEEVGFGLLGEGGLKHAATGAADSFGVGQGEGLTLRRAAVAGGDQARDAAPFDELAPDEVPRTFRRDERAIDPGGGDDLTEMDVEPVRAEQHVAGFEVRLDVLGVDVALNFVGQEDVDQVPLVGGLGGRDGCETVLHGLIVIGGAGTLADDDVAAGITQVLRVGMSLAAVADDRDRLAFEQTQVGVLVVKHRGRHQRSPSSSVQLGKISRITIPERGRRYLETAPPAD
jgi:ketol-acid reductoisomerase